MITTPILGRRLFENFYYCRSFPLPYPALSVEGSLKISTIVDENKGKISKRVEGSLKISTIVDQAKFDTKERSKAL